MPAFYELLRAPWSPESVAIAAVAAFGMGAAHALSPGHGKTLAAAYLAGSRGTLKHAAALGCAVTFTHTASVFVLGVAALFLTAYVMPQRLAEWLSMASGLSIVAFGIWLLRKRILQLRRSHSHSHHHHHHPVPEEANLRAVIALGAAGGLAPCPSALVLMLTSISVGQIGLGLLLLLTFSMGLASVLVAIGAAVLYARRFVPAELPRLRWLPVASATVILLAGIVITVAGPLSH